MSGTEIKTQIDALQNELNEELRVFILNPRVKEIMAKMDDLRKECTHDFVNGTCIFCGQEEE